jgi:hypothetical protein
MSSAVAAACGVVALSALTVPAAHADERFGDTDITGVVVNDGNPVVVGTGARTVTAEVTATDPSGLQQVNATLYHGPFGAPDSTVASTAACGPTVATTTTCTLTFTLTPGTAPADEATPKPVKWGRVLTVTGGVRNADWATGTSVGAAAGRPVSLQFRPKGSSTYCTLKTVPTVTGGTLSTTVRAYTDGSYRWSYAGTADTAAAVSAGTVVDVVG